MLTVTRDTRELASTQVRSRAKTLDGIDASFLYADSRNVSMHTIKVLILEPGTGLDVDRPSLREHVAEVARRLPSLHRRVVEVPFRLHHPRWVDVERLDIDAHLRFIELDGAADDDWQPTRMHPTLANAIAELSAQPLSRAHPLWMLYIITGLPGERVAAVVKVHHSLGDGRAAANLLAELTGDRAASWSPPPGRGRVTPKSPDRMRLFWRGLISRLAILAKLPLFVWRAIRGAVRVGQESEPVGAEGKLFAGPRTFFGGRLGRARRFAVRGFSVEQIRAIRHAREVSFNDVLVAIVSGAFSRLRETGKLSGAPLVFSMPFGIEDGQRRRIDGNYVSNELCCLCDDVDDPGERLAAVARATKLTKWRHRLLGPRRLRMWTELATKRLVALAWKLIPRFAPPPINLIISNVAGPKQARHIGEVRIESLCSVGPLPERTGLNITAWSYEGLLQVSLLADGTQWSAAAFERLCDGLDESFEELVGLLDESEAAVPDAVNDDGSQWTSRVAS